MAIAIYERANQLNDEGKYTEALELYDQLLAQNPEHPAILSTMGTIYLRAENTIGLAIMMLRRAIETSKEPRADWISNLGVAYKHAGLTDKAMQAFERSIAIQPNGSNLTGMGSLLIENGDPLKAIAVLDKAVEHDPGVAMTRWNLALALLEAGQWDRAWDEHEWGMKPGGMRRERLVGDRPQWDGKSPGKIVLWGEQGIGDEIMFASMIPDVMKTNEVILDCHPRLKTFFERSFPGVKCYGTRKDAELPWVKDEDFQWQCAMGSLGKFYRRSREAFPGTPYLKADPLPRGAKFRVGISWTGGKKASRVARRTVPLSWWDSIFANQVNGVEFVSLQYTDCEAEIEQFERETAYKVLQFHESKSQDYYEAARLTASCDLVITVCTSILHVAGALGVPCWIMVPTRPDWRCQMSGPMPWYRSVRQYRQPEEGMAGWLAVTQRIGLDLSDLTAQKKQRTA